MDTVIDCTLLGTRRHFEDYFATIWNVTLGNISTIAQCKAEACAALWGFGNPDISGIGMAIGYVLEVALAFCIILTFYILDSRSRTTRVKWLKALTLSAAQKLFDNTVFFAFSIQMASIIVLSKANFGLSTDGMGAITMRITWLISTLDPSSFGPTYHD